MGGSTLWAAVVADVGGTVSWRNLQKSKVVSAGMHDIYWTTPVTGVSFRPRLEKALHLSLRLSLSNTYGGVLLSNPNPSLKWTWEGPTLPTNSKFSSTE